MSVLSRHPILQISFAGVFSMLRFKLHVRERYGADLWILQDISAEVDSMMQITAACTWLDIQVWAVPLGQFWLVLHKKIGVENDKNSSFAIILQKNYLFSGRR